MNHITKRKKNQKVEPLLKEDQSFAITPEDRAQTLLTHYQHTSSNDSTLGFDDLFKRRVEEQIEQEAADFLPSAHPHTP